MYSLKEQVLYKSTFIAVPSVLLYRDSTVLVSSHPDKYFSSIYEIEVRSFKSVSLIDLTKLFVLLIRSTYCVFNKYKCEGISCVSVVMLMRQAICLKF